MDEIERLGAIYRYWVLFPGNWAQKRLQEHCENIGMGHSVMSPPATYEEYCERLKFTREARGQQLGRWTFHFDAASGRALFIFEDDDDAFLFSMRTPLDHNLI